MSQNGLQEGLNKFLKESRKKTLSENDQLTLGELIEKIESIVKYQKDREEEADVVYDFEYLFPTSIDSWRGSYDELALDWSSDGDRMKVSSFLKMIKECIGKTFVGWKGGDFIMDKDTPIWIANSGNAGSTALIDVVNNGYEVILMTAYRKY
jgi:hypothetical protein